MTARVSMLCNALCFVVGAAVGASLPIPAATDESKAFKAIAALPVLPAVAPKLPPEVVEYCVGGVLYLEFPRGAVSVAYSQRSGIKWCKEQQ